MAARAPEMRHLPANLSEEVSQHKLQLQQFGGVISSLSTFQVDRRSAVDLSTSVLESSYQQPHLETVQSDCCSNNNPPTGSRSTTCLATATAGTGVAMRGVISSRLSPPPSTFLSSDRFATSGRRNKRNVVSETELSSGIV